MKSNVDRVYNFCAGPAMLPTEVLEEVQAELLNWHGLGSSVMELSHRGQPFIELTEGIERDLRELLAVPDNYQVLFVQGGGRGQFAMVPLNLLGDHTGADYINTGIWSELAIAEGQKYCDANQAASSESSGYTLIPERDTWQLKKDAAYVHIVDNETINGVEFPTTPDVGDVPLVCDMSSNFLSRPFDVSQYGVCYAGAQKNVGPAGMAIVLVRDDLIGHAKDITPSIFDYANHAKAHSLYQTPPSFTWYVAGKVLQWLLKQGGLTAMAQINQRKSQLLYETIDQSDFYHNNIDPRYRSRMNVVFNVADESRIDDFLTQAQAQGLCYLKGHRRVGGLRASIYNAMSEAGVQSLVDFMTEFERRQ